MERSDGIRIKRFAGKEALPYAKRLAELRIEVFREYPYLYDGTMEYEEKYLRAYAESAESLFVLAFDGDEVVGVSTGVPLSDAESEFQAAFQENGYNLERVFYFGESVLRSGYRGSGIGSAFMREREAYARELGRFEICAFCAVQREESHPLRPSGYAPLDAFWRKYGFDCSENLVTSFRWKEINEAGETEKPMRFWLKRL